MPKTQATLLEDSSTGKGGALRAIRTSNLRRGLVTSFGILLVVLPAFGQVVDDSNAQYTRFYLQGNNLYAWFGRHIAADDDRIIATMFSELHPDVPSQALVFARNGSEWAFEAALTPPGQTLSNTVQAVDIDGDVIAVSVPYENSLDCNPRYPNFTGAVYLYIREAGEWNQKAKLVPPGDPAVICNWGPDYVFGDSVAVSDDTVIVGAPFLELSPPGGGNRIETGAAFIFRRDEAMWRLEQTLMPESLTGEHRFGRAVSISGNIVAVGEPSSANDDREGRLHVYKFTDKGWIRQTTATSDVPIPGDCFGGSLGLHGRHLVVGHHGPGCNAGLSGTQVHLFSIDSVDGLQRQATFVPGEDLPAGRLARPSLRDNTVVLSTVGAGLIHAYKRSGSRWLRLNSRPETPAHVLEDDYQGGFGASSAISLSRIVVSAPSEGVLRTEGNVATTVTGSRGVVYVFNVPRFTDVPSDHWTYNYTEALAAAAITSGCGPDRFCPNDPLTRSQTAVLLVRAMRGGDYSPEPASGNFFLDVPAEGFAAAYIERLYMDGITLGCGNNRYCPNRFVTRAQMAVLLLRAKHGAVFVPPSPSGDVFEDVAADYWAAAWIEQLAKERITLGCSINRFCPEQPVRRDQMAVFMGRTFGLQ